MKQIRIQRKRATSRQRLAQRQRDITSDIEATTTTRTAPDLTAADELLARIDELVAEA